MWVIKDSKGTIQIQTIRWTRQASIDAFIGNNNFTWKELSKAGWKASIMETI